MNNLAVLLKDQGHYADAEPLYREALQGRREALGPRHPDTLRSLNDLATVLKDQGRYADAEPLYRRSLTINEKAFGPDHTMVAESLNNLAQEMSPLDHGFHERVNRLYDTWRGE